MTDVLPTSFGPPTRDTTAEEDLARAKKEIAGPVPLIEASPDCLVTLPRGLTYNGSRHTDAEVRELTGVDEEALAKLRRPEEVYDAVVLHGVVRIGTVRMEDMPNDERQHYLRSLLIGERDQLFVAIARVTYGDERKYAVSCPRCQREQDVILTVSEEFHPRKGDLTSPFEYTTSKGFKLEYRLATGAEQLSVLSKDTITAAEMNTILLSECILSVDKQMVLDPVNFARNLSIRDRQELLAILVDRQPSMELKVTYECLGCLEEQQFTLGWLDLFRT